MSDTSFVTSPDFPSSCPICGKTEGTYGIGRSRWGYCQTHKTNWIAGYDMAAANEATDEQRRRYDKLQNEIGLGEFKYIGPDAEEYERHKARNASERIMPLFVFARRRDIERETSLILAGQLVIDIPRTEKPKRRHQRMIIEIVQKLREQAQSGRMPDDAVVYGWRNNFRPPNADEYIGDDAFMGGWAKTRLVIALRVDPHDDGIRLDSDLRRRLGLFH